MTDDDPITTDRLEAIGFTDRDRGKGTHWIGWCIEISPRPHARSWLSYSPVHGECAWSIVSESKCFINHPVNMGEVIRLLRALKVTPPPAPISSIAAEHSTNKGNE